MASVRELDPVIVVGSGIAGSLLALSAAEFGPVVMITKEALGDGSTRRAQGGIAAAIDGHDSVEAHVADTLAAGAGLCDIEAVTRICREGPGQVAALLARGVDFDRRDGHLRLAREGAHSAARVVHAGGDATGAHIVGALSAALRRDPRIELAEDERALEVIVHDGRVVGLRSVGPTGREHVRAARAVALAAGGMGQLYTRTTNPLGATADGPALAARAGAALADLELVQFHPTALALGDGPLALVSEAVRGEGAILRDAAGHRFMPDEHPMAELGPRDVVARAIARRAAALGADVDPRPAPPRRRRGPPPLPDGRSALRRTRPRPRARPDPGDARRALRHRRRADPTWPGRTTLPGLFAVGECAATGAHGANRLASNGLLEAAVLAAGAAEALRGDLDDWPDGPVAHAVEVPADRPHGLRCAPRPADRHVAGRRRGARRSGPRPGRPRPRARSPAAPTTPPTTCCWSPGSPPPPPSCARRAAAPTTAATTPRRIPARHGASPGSATSRTSSRPPSPGAPGPSPWRQHDHLRIACRPAFCRPRRPPSGQEELWERAWAARRALGSRAVILGHHYQRDEVIAFADVTGDSFLLARRGAAATEAELVVFLGVYFMAEAADVLRAPHQTVVLPDLGAGCHLAECADIFTVRDAWKQMTAALPGKRVIPLTYMNSGADLKAFVGEHGGAVCTSGNAEKAFRWALSEGDAVFFFPDEHLGRNTACRLGMAPGDPLVWDPRKADLGGIAEGDLAADPGDPVEGLLQRPHGLHHPPDRRGADRGPGRAG